MSTHGEDRIGESRPILRQHWAGGGGHPGGGRATSGPSRTADVLRREARDWPTAGGALGEPVGSADGAPVPADGATAPSAVACPRRCRGATANAGGGRHGPATDEPLYGPLSGRSGGPKPPSEGPVRGGTAAEPRRLSTVEPLRPTSGPRPGGGEVPAPRIRRSLGTDEPTAAVRELWLSRPVPRAQTRGRRRGRDGLRGVQPNHPAGTWRPGPRVARHGSRR